MINLISHSVDNRNLASYLDELNKKIRQLTDKICCLIDAVNDGNGGGTTPIQQTTSSGVNVSVPAGFRSIAITRTTSNGSPVAIQLSDGSTYDLDVQFETFIDASSIGGALPAYTITSTSDSWKWHGIK